ncbi:MAG: hypothetical protein HC927_01750 [Deltaproteobacteria bacterium]|nr:hypothetical protein [Deltaproteobacteria bacterium]
MSRVRATSLVLVNWRAVFYENYALDRNVTALEGDNGAGKTTVMIAAYVVLLPDMTRLRFTNVGEGEAIGGDRGIHGRLGNPGRPSYAVIEFDLGNERLLAGVRLEPKGEPSVELTAFVISELPRPLALQDLLLLRVDGQDQIPEFEELRENAVRLGARFHRCRTIKEYFTILFERGITPLRLVSDEDRNRFSDMLRTSMTGGISRALTAELRSFLLKEERGLADTLVRMRGNLDACRRTRSEVQEARTLEREISGIYEAGHAMFSAALAATRERAEEMRRRVDEATAKRDEAALERERVVRAREQKVEEHEELRALLRATRQGLQVADVALQRLVHANTIAGRIAGLEAELASSEFECERAEQALERAEAERTERARQQARAEDDFRRAADGLASLQEGLAELHRRADAHRMVNRRLAEAREVLGVEAIAIETLAAQRETLRAEKQHIDQERGQIDERIESSRTHREQHGLALTALALMTKAPRSLEGAYEGALAALARFARLEELASQVDSLTGQLARSREDFDRQRAARALARSLEREPDELLSSTAVKQIVHEVDRAIVGQQDEIRTVQEQLADTRRELQAHEERHTRLEGRAHRWRELDALAARLERELGEGLRSADELDVARTLLDERADHLRHRRAELMIASEQVANEARALEQSGGAFPDDLLTTRDLVGGQLLATYFDDIEPARAGWVQARLGPLAEAIVVEDARAAAQQLSATDRELDTIRLIEGSQATSFVDLEATDISPSRDVIVEDGVALRVTRISERPTLGRKARQRRIDELRVRIDTSDLERAEIEAELGRISGRRQELALLTREIETLAAGDPTDELRQLGSAKAEANQRGQALRGRFGLALAHPRLADDARTELARATRGGSLAGS